MKQYAAIDDTVYFWFAGNDTSGSGGDGASPAADVRLAGAAADAAPVYSPTPTLLSHVNYPAGAYEISIAASAANGFAASNTYAVFCTLAIDSQNPTGFVGSFDTKPVESNPTQIGDSAQSLADLKDFADAGYDPATNKVEGVKLADTVTTLTGHTAQTGDSFARLGAPAGVSVSADILAIDNFVDELESRLTAVRAGYLDELSAANLPADIDLVLADTGELQTDWVNGGRLDLLLDACALEATVAALNNISTAQVNAECDNALSDYDSPTNAEMVAAFTEIKGATWAAGTDTLEHIRNKETDIESDTNELQTNQGNWVTATGFNTVVPDAAGVAPTAAEIKTELEQAGSSLAQILTDTGTTLNTHLTDIKGATFAGGTDSLEAIRDRGDAAWTTGAGGSDRLLMVDTTIATLASQTSFTLSAGSADDDAYNNCTIVIEDASTATQKAVGIISDYVGATKTVTLKYDPAIFTMAISDKVYILAENALKATLANRQLNVAADGDVAGNVDGSVASVVGHTAQTGDSFARLGAPAGVSVSADILAIDNFVDELESRLTAARAGYLDNLSAGAVALASGVDLTSIHGAALTETVNGYLAAAFVKLFDVVTPVLVASDVMRGTDSAALAATALTDVTWTDARAGYLDELAAANLPADLDAVLADTNMLQTDWVNGGRLDLLLDACALEATVAALNNISTAQVNTECDNALSDYDSPTNAEMVAAFTEIKGATWAAGTDTLEHIRDKETDIETDTNELQTDWTNGGRLDLLLDAIPTTAMRGTDGANTVVPDAAGVAATPTEVATALTDIHLDHLLAVNYDPASKPGVATALLNELVENDGGVSRYTANALEQAPSGGTNPNVLIDTTLASVTSQTVVVLTAGSNDDDAYKDQAVVVYDASDSDYPSVRKCSAYVGATKTLTLDSAPDFTLVVGDGAKVFVTAPGTSAPTAAQNADAVWDELKAAHTIADSFGDYLDDEITSRNATTPPTVGAIRTEMEGAGSKLLAIEGYTDKIDDGTDGLTAIKAEVEGLAGAAMRGTDSANTVVPDAAGVAPTAAEIKTELEQAGSSLAQILTDTGTTLDTHLTDIKGATFAGATDSLEAIRDRGDAAWTTGSGGSAADIADAVWDEATSGHTGAGSFGAKNQNQVPSETLNDYKATGFNTVVPDVAGTAAGLHTTTDGKIDTVDANVDAILADTNELQTDWGNGGRLDLILDAIAADTTTDIPALIAALNDLSSAEANAACDTALTDYDPPTRAEATTDKDAIITEVNANETKIDTIDTVVDAIKAKTDNLPSGIAKNVALPKFSIFMVETSDHVTGATGKTVTGTISKDGGSVVSLTNAITEVAGGLYVIASGLTQAEMNADVIDLIFSATGCDDRVYNIHTS